ncbi:amino acid ABC transporter permease [Basilea psittacipulmonis]|nr:amino acid ABC transporter permease [Basilea psittacipulmonis]
MDQARATMVAHAFWPMVKAGFLVSLPLAIISFIFGLLIAVGVAFFKVMPVTHVWHKILLKFLNLYVAMIRGTPLLVQLCIVFYGLPAVGIELDPIPTAIIGFSLNVGAYASETVRASIQSIHKGQWEASAALGMSYIQTFLYVILSQATRVAVPPLSNTFISLFKDTSLASVVTVTELFRVAQQEGNRSYDFLPVFIEAALVYWGFCWVLFYIQKRIERRQDRYVTR